MKNLISIFIVSILFSSCAGQIKHKMPTTMMHSPECIGDRRIELGGGIVSGPTSEVTSDVATKPPTGSTPIVINDSRLLLRAGIGVVKKIKVDGFLETDRITAKVQVHGQDFQNAEAGNFSIALLGVLTARNDEGRGYGTTYRDHRFVTATDAKFNMNSNGLITAALFGYRFSSLFLVYSGASYQWHRYSGDYEIISSSQRGRYAGEANVRSAHLGVDFSFNKNVIFRVEDAYSVARIPSASAKSSAHHVGLYLTASFSAFTGDQ